MDLDEPVVAVEVCSADQTLRSSFRTQAANESYAGQFCRRMRWAEVALRLRRSQDSAFSCRKQGLPLPAAAAVRPDSVQPPHAGGHSRQLPRNVRF